MIGFFRRIRHKLANENQFIKYSRYAIGEIVLVMVGILLALQVNNWSNERKDRLLEEKILEEIQSNLEIDLEEIIKDIKVIEQANESCRRMIIHLKEHSIPSDDFFNDAEALKFVPHFDPNRSGYGLLESNGVKLILNDSLRTSISNIYELGYPYYNKYENERIQFKVHQTNSFLLNNFDWFSDPKEKFEESSFYISEKDYKKVKNDESLRKLVNAILYENLLLLDRSIRTKQKIIDLLAMINKELLKIKEKQS